MIALGCVLVVKLPPGDRIKAFEKLDFVTFMLLAPGMALLCGVLSLGRIEWWFSTPWLGICLAMALVLIVAAIVIEHNRKNPLINTRWLSSGMMVRLGIVMIMIRIVLAEQNTGAVGLLQQLGLLNDQMRGLSLAIIGGMTLGIATSALTIRPAHLNWPIVTSLAVMIVASLMDAHASPVTRANNMYLSQFLLGFSSTFFYGAGDADRHRQRSDAAEESGELCGAVRHEPEPRRADRLRDSRHLSGLARKISLQPAGRSPLAARSQRHGAPQPVWRAVQQPARRPGAAERAKHQPAADGGDAAGERTGL
ncbi:hypothetical protein OJE16_14355 [Pantoea tagorei]